jgi:NAD(P)-dependent dehydrogenase (short-subunit alcohol dehydrogenase family)
VTLDDAAAVPALLARPGSTVVITGGTGGIGPATATALAATGAHLVPVGGDPGRGELARQTVGGDSRFVAADLDSLDGVRRLTGQLLDAHGRPDVLLANAGGLYAERRTTDEGHVTGCRSARRGARPPPAGRSSSGPQGDDGPQTDASRMTRACAGQRGPVWLNGGPCCEQTPPPTGARR